MALLFLIALAIPTVLTAPADPGGVSTSAQLISAVISPSVSQSFHSPASTSVSVGTTYLLTPLQTTVTSAITIVVTDIATTTIAITPTSTSTVVETVTTTTTVTTPNIPWGNRTAWAAPPDMKDLSAFNVTHFPSGKQNVAIIDSISALAIVPGGSVFTQNIIESQSTTNTQNVTGFTSALQLVYPAYSVNPSSKSPGGAEFYASPLNLSDAKNVTMEYSVYFPADFDWVKGGKLPGLYGGHTGCSGGVAAEDCFSTRLMWRQGGAVHSTLQRESKQMHYVLIPSQSAMPSTGSQSEGDRSTTAQGIGRHCARTSCSTRLESRMEHSLCSLTGCR